jgi:hypothetical protein
MLTTRTNEPFLFVSSDSELGKVTETESVLVVEMATVAVVEALVVLILIGINSSSLISQFIPVYIAAH